MASTRPTKKQKELLTYIEEFINENGYSPSYREIMVGLGYSSVATVAKHISNLVTRGHLLKRENSARSLEPANMDMGNHVIDHKEWLCAQIDKRIDGGIDTDDLFVLIGSLKVLGFEAELLHYTKLLREINSPPD